MITTQELACRAIIQAIYKQRPEDNYRFRINSKLQILTMQKENNRKQKSGGKGRGMEGRAGVKIFLLQSRGPKDTTFNGKLNKSILSVHCYCIETVRKYNSANSAKHSLRILRAVHLAVQHSA